MASFEDYANQRPLTDKGRDEARAFGKAEKTNEARGGPVRTDDPKRYDALRKLLSIAPAKGANNVISSHGNPYMAVFGGPYLAEGEIAVIRPDESKPVGRIKLEDWPALK